MNATQNAAGHTPKFTPGPWEMATDGDSISVYSEDHGRIAFLHDPVHGADAKLEANARLIASAPTLHAENEELRDTLNRLVQRLELAAESNEHFPTFVSSSSIFQAAKDTLARSQSLHAQPNGQEGGK